MRKFLSGLIIVLILIAIVYYVFSFYPFGRKIPSCIEEPEKVYIFCKYSEPVVNVVRKKVSVTLNLSRKELADNTFLIIYSYLDNFTVSGIKTSPTAENYVYFANVTGRNILDIKMEGKIIEPIESPIIYKREPLTLENFVMIVQHSCVNGKCEEYEIFR